MQFLKAIFCVILALSVTAVTFDLQDEERELFKTVVIQRELQKRIPAYEKLIRHPLNENDKAMLKKQIESEYDEGLLGKKSILSKVSALFSKGKDAFVGAMKKSADKVKALKKTDDGLSKTLDLEVKKKVVHTDTAGATAAGNRVNPFDDPNPFNPFHNPKPNPFADLEEFGRLARTRF